jgi:Ca-activated chloride channel family protein
MLWLAVTAGLLASSIASAQRVLTPAAAVLNESADAIPRMRVSVRLVLVPVTVLGAIDHRFTTSDFQLFDNDQPQRIAVFDADTRNPLSLVLAVDTSASTGSHLEQEKNAALELVSNLLQPHDEIELIAFSHIVTAETPFTSDSPTLSRAIHALRPGGATSLFDMIYLASRELSSRKGRKALIIISDGGDTTSGVSFQTALREAIHADAVIYSVIVVPIGSDAGRDIGGEHALEYLSEQTGGESFSADAHHLSKPMTQVLEALRREYLLGFYPESSGPPQPGVHRIRVEVRYPGLTLLNRKRYYED